MFDGRQEDDSRVLSSKHVLRQCGGGGSCSALRALTQTGSVMMLTEREAETTDVDDMPCSDNDKCCPDMPRSEKEYVVSTTAVALLTANRRPEARLCRSFVYISKARMTTRIGNTWGHAAACHSMLSCSSAGRSFTHSHSATAVIT